MAFKGFEIELEGVQPAGVIATVPDGYYKGKITSVADKDNVAEGKRPGCYVNIVVGGPSHQGTPLRPYMTFPLKKSEESDDFKSGRATWSALLRSVNGDEKINGIKKAKIQESSLTGKEVYFFYQNPPTPEEKYPDYTWVTQKQYDAAIAAGGAAPANAKPAGAAANGQAGKVETAAAAPSKDALDDALGI